MENSSEKNLETISFKLPKGLMARLDEIAARGQESRSELLRRLIEALARSGSLPGDMSQGPLPVPAPAPTPTDLPLVLSRCASDIAVWKDQLDLEAVRHKRLYWIFNLPPLLINAMAAAGLLLVDSNGTRIVFMAATALSGIDALSPQGRLAMTYKIAAQELEELGKELRLKWAAGATGGRDKEKLTEEILDWALTEQKKISRDIYKAESQIKEASTLGKLRPFKTLAQMKKPD